MITKQQLNEWEELAKAATGGPWHVDENGADMIVGRPAWPCRRNYEDGEWTIASVDDLMGEYDHEREANAAFIASSRTAVPALVERVRELTGMVERFCNIMQHCSVTDGSCCCGEDMAKHSEFSGHSPTDHGSYVADQALEDALALLGRQS